MNILGELFSGGFYGVLGDARAMSEAELAQRQYNQVWQTMNARHFDYRMLQNYRPPVHVPQGWADWYEVGDALV